MVRKVIGIYVGMVLIACISSGCAIIGQFGGRGAPPIAEQTIPEQTTIFEEDIKPQEKYEISDAHEMPMTVPMPNTSEQIQIPTNNYQASNNISMLRNQLIQKTQEIEALKTKLMETDVKLQEYKNHVSDSTSDVASKPATSSGLFPPNARPGECYARVFIPAVYHTVSERVLKRDATERIEIVPEKYEFIDQRVLISEAHKKYIKIPAEYKWIEEKILVKPAHTMWKKGTGSIQKIDQNTGEIMCMVEVPPLYKTIKKRILIKPESVQEVTVPAQFKTIKVKKMVEPPRQVRMPIPAEYETVTKRVKVAEGKIEWRRTMCETNITNAVVKEIQIALKKAGFRPGPIDGMLGSQTRKAIQLYQKKRGLAVGSITYETLKKLGLHVK